MQPRNWFRYAWQRYVLREQARITVVFKDGQAIFNSNINRSALDSDKVVYWAIRGTVMDTMQMATMEKYQKILTEVAFSAFLKTKEVAAFSVPKAFLDAVEQRQNMQTAGVIPPCGKPGECSTDECQTCLQNPNLPGDDVTLASLTKGSKF